MTKKPRLLFVTFYFPPLRAIASVRTGNMAKYLSLSGWDVTVVTPDPSLWADVDPSREFEAGLDQHGVRRIYTQCRWPYLFPRGHLKEGYGKQRGLRRLYAQVVRCFARIMKIDKMIGWYVEVERACAALRPGDVDVVLASGNPFGSFQLAQRLAQRLECPVVFDYRDLWTGNPDARGSKKERSCQTERRVLGRCAAVSVVSPSMAKFLEQRFDMAGKVQVVSNGYSPCEHEGVEPKNFEHFAIVYTGQFLPPKRSADVLMQAFRKLADSGEKRPWKFHYYGADGDHVRLSARQHGVEHCVVLHGAVSRGECLSAIRGAGVAAIVVSDFDTGDVCDRGVITGKIFEPIAMGTPMLVIAPSGFDVESVVQTVGNGAVFSGSQSDRMADYVRNLMDGNKVKSNCPEAYSWPKIIQRMDTLLRSVIKPAASGVGAEDIPADEIATRKRGPK